MSVPARSAAVTLALPAAPPPTRISSSWGKIGLFQVFDDMATAWMTTSQILSDANRYDVVWGTAKPSAWDSGHPGMLASRYFIMQQDDYNASGHTLTWWKANHPSWILYACDPSGTPTHEIAYGGYNIPDVPLDFHNPAVVDYQIRQLMGPYAIANGDTALAFDQVVFYNFMGGGNPAFGQTVLSGYYACGIWQGTTFVRRYSTKSDPAWTADTLAWVKTARSILTTDTVLAPHHIGVMVNHPFGSVTNPNELQLLANTDAIVDEVGFSNYGYYQSPANASIFKHTVDYMVYAQQHGVATLIIDRFLQDKVTVTPDQLEYSIATYLMGNEQGADLFVTPTNGAGYGYGSEQYHPEYATKIGTPCGEYYGGSSYDALNPQIYYRKFANALVVVNSGSLPLASEVAHLPTGHTYTDLEGRTVKNPLTVNSNDAWVLLTTNGCS